MTRRTTIRKQPEADTLSGRIRNFLSVERVIVGAIILFSLVMVGALVLSSLANQPVDIEGLEQIAVGVGGHSESPVNYNQTPPAGGVHYPVWQNCGVYDQPILNEMGVHSLEHGAVWITYRPDLSASDVETLSNLVQQSSHRLLSPYPNLPSPIVASAWGYQVRLERADDPRLGQFIRQYEQGPDTPERGAPCSGAESRALPEFPR